MEDKKMTVREFYNAVINANLSDEMTEYATAAIAKMDAANEKRKNTPSKKSIENAPLVEEITKLLGSEAQTATEIGEKVGISTQKASALLRKLVVDGVATSTEVKGKKGMCKAYTLA